MRKRPFSFVLLSYLEGLCYAIMVSSAESFSIFFSVKQNLSPIPLALISTLPLLCGALAQYFIPPRVKEGRVRRAILLCFLVQIIGLSGLVWNSHRDFAFDVHLVSLCLYWIGGLSAGPLWIDWMSTLVPHQEFRLFLSKRNGFVAFGTLVSYLGVAFVVQKFPHWPPAFIFSLGLGGRLCSMALQYAISKRYKPLSASEQSVPLFQEPERIGDPKIFRKIILTSFPLTGMFKGAVAVASPFFLPYMVHELNFSVWQYVVMTAVPLLSRSLFLGSWGKASFGFRPFVGLEICALMIGFWPFLWTLTTNYSLLAGIEFCSGLFWGGFELSCVLIVQSFLRDSPRRILGLQMAAMNGGAVIGALIGGYLLREQVAYKDVFIISSALRLWVACTLIVHFARYPQTKFKIHAYGSYLTSVLSVRPTLGLVGRMVFPRRPNTPIDAGK